MLLEGHHPRITIDGSSYTAKEVIYNHIIFIVQTTVVNYYCNKVYGAGTWGLYYKTFYCRNLRIFVFVLVKPFQPSLMFAGKAGA